MTQIEYIQDIERQLSEAKVELVRQHELLAMLEIGGVRIVSDGGSFTLKEFRQGIADLRARAKEESDDE